MPAQGHQDGNEALRAALMHSANRAATDAIIKHTTLRGTNAEKIARYAVHAAAPKIRAEYMAKAGGYTKREAVLVLGSTVVLSGLNLAVMYHVARRGSTAARVLAAVSAAAHLSLSSYANWRDAQVRGQARKDLAKAVDITKTAKAGAA